LPPEDSLNRRIWNGLAAAPGEMNEQGELTRIHQEEVYPIASLRAGLHDGRHMSFVMQEGTFWRAHLWQRAGKFRSDLRQAGDWDLWRRFADYAQLVSTDMVLAAHRRSPGQLTADKSVYFGEVDAVIKQDIKELHQDELNRFQQWCGRTEEFFDKRYYGKLLRFQEAKDSGQGSWETEDRPYPIGLKPTVSVTNGLTSLMLSPRFGVGFGPTNAGDALFNLLPGHRVVTSSEARLTFDARRDALHRIFLRCRSFEPGTRIKLIHHTRTILNVNLPVTSHGWEALVTAEAGFKVGTNELSLEIVGSNPDSMPFFVVTSCEAVSTI
jgi:hypothetical protein